MSSEHDESSELMDEGVVKSDAEKSDSPSPKKVGGVAKPRRRGRRGKKRKQRKESGDSNYSEEGIRALESNEEEEKANYSGQMLRPNAPHAPKNSTQFIIDDHNECRLYMSFESPNPYPTANIMEPIGEDAAYVDVDYQYESPQDFDNSAYYDREFELSYKSNRFEELLRLPRERLVSGLRQLEQRLKELSDDLVKENPSPILEKLQHDLLELQEKHCELQETNTRLTALVAQKERMDHKKHDKRLEDSSVEHQNVEDETENEKQLSDDENIEIQEKLPSGVVLGISDPICIEQLKRSTKDDSLESVEQMERKDCLEGQLSKVGISEQGKASPDHI